jgi:hypothetical protein
MFSEGVVPPDAIERALRDVRAIADGVRDLRAVRHPLGFLCLPIERRDDGSGACVHVWDPRLARERSTTSETHAHSWELLSVVILGELRNDLVAIADELPTHRLFEVRSEGDVDEMRATSRLVSRRTVSTQVVRAGETYTVAPGLFHATVASHATTIAFSRPAPGTLDQSLGAIDAGTHQVRRTRCDLADTALAARMVADQL